MAADAFIKNTVVNGCLGDEVCNGAGAPDLIDGVQMKIVSLPADFAGVNILAQGRAETGGFKIVDSQGITGQKRMDIAVADQTGKRFARISVEGTGRADYPGDMTVFPFIPEQLIDKVIIHGKGGFPRAALTKNECFIHFCPLMPKTVRIDENAVLTCSVRPTATRSPARIRRNSRVAIRPFSRTATQSIRLSSARSH